MSSGQGGLSRSLAKRVTGHGRLYADDAVTERGTFSFEQTSATKTMLLNLPRCLNNRLPLQAAKRAANVSKLKTMRTSLRLVKAQQLQFAAAMIGW